MTAALTEKGRAVLSAYREKSHQAGDGLSEEWRGMLEDERVFWLKVSRQSTRHATCANWYELPADVRAVIKNNLYRAARRAAQILHVPDWKDATSGGNVGQA